MQQTLIFTPTYKYIVSISLYGLLFWIAFNLLTGFITGNTSLNDNYFILFIVIVVTAFRNSYKVKIDRGHITTYRGSMVMSNIDLYKASDVIKEKDRLTVILQDDSRFSVKYAMFNQTAQSQLLKLVTPQVGERPDIVSTEAGKHEINKIDKQRENYTKAVIRGVGFIVVGGSAVVHGVITIPATESINDMLNQLLIPHLWLISIFVIGIGFISYGLFGKYKLKEGSHN